MKQYTIVGGVNGVGKSSLSGVLRHQLPDMGVIIDPDSIAVQEHCDRLTAGKLAISKVNVTSLLFYFFKSSSMCSK